MTEEYKIMVILLYYWKAKKSAPESYRLIREIESSDVLNETKTHKNLVMIKQTYKDNNVLVDQVLLIIVD